jgi:dihydroorotase
VAELYQGAHVVDPQNNIDDIVDIRVKDGKVAEVGKDLDPKGATVINLKGKHILPGVIDMHVHFREPGTRGETIASGAAAALRGGVTTAVAMPNTEPAIDTLINLGSVQELAKKADKCKVEFIAAVSVGRKGEQVTEIQLLSDAGAVAFSDDGSPVMNPEVMRVAMLAAAQVGKPVIQHCEDCHLSAGGVMNEGEASVLKGLKGQSHMSESVMVGRDLILAQETGAHYHVAHLSCRSSLVQMRWAADHDIKVTAEVTPHHFILADSDIPGYDTYYKMNPPLRTKEDVLAMREALKDGTLTVIASDHAPHPEDKKALEFENAPFGIMGVETMLPLSLKYLVASGFMPLSQVVACLTTNPAQILGLNDVGHLGKGACADFVVVDMNEKYTYDVTTTPSQSQNTPFQGEEFPSKIQATYVNGRKLYEN